MAEGSWESKAAAKRAAVLDQIPPQWRLSTEDIERARGQRDQTGPFIGQFLETEDTAITSLGSVSIVNAVKDKKLSATTVATAFCKTAAIAHQIGNCLHEFFFDQALERARFLDDYYAEHGTTLGPLHGLPISLKDQFHVKGVDTTMGYVGWIGKNLGTGPGQTHNVESQLVTELLSLGAILYCKTSLPQTLLLGETNNNIFGRTLNPHNRNLSCGGSSGGEGALLALGGSSLGVGTDIGGSVRIPAAFCGLFGIKPTPERATYRDAANTNPGQTTYRSAVGFLGTSLDSLELMLKSTLSAEPWLRDPAVVPIPFRQEVFDSYLNRADAQGRAKPSALPLKIGVFWDDGLVAPHPPVARGMRLVADALKGSGHKTTKWEPPSHAIAAKLRTAFLAADGGLDIDQHLRLSGEPLIPELAKEYPLQEPAKLLDYQDHTLRGLEYECAYSDYWNSTADEDGQAVDAVVMPVAPHAAVVPGQYFHVAYTGAINLLNYSAVVIPVTKAKKDVDVADSSYRPLSDADRKNWELYDPETYDGAPVGLQIVTRKFEEEKALAIANIVCNALQSATP